MNELTPTQQVARLNGTDHTEQLYKLAMEQAEELERVKKDLDDACAVIACKDHQRDDLKRQVEELKLTSPCPKCGNTFLKTPCCPSCGSIPLVDSTIDQLRAEHTMLKVQNDSLDRELTRRDNENAELLKDKKRLERLMTLERGDLLWFHQEQDKRRALDILMEDNE